MVPWPFPQFRLPGWERGIGLHLDDMHIFLEDDTGGVELADKAPLNSYIRDDDLRDQVFGCGVDYRTQSVFFTHNGSRLEDEFPATSRFMQHDLLAAVGVSDSDLGHFRFSSTVNVFTVNFGGERFRWMDANEGRWFRRPGDQFERSAGNDCPPAYEAGPSAPVAEKDKGWTPE